MLTTEIMPGIEKTPRVCGGEACIAFTRVPLWHLQSLRRQGLSDAEILLCYPKLKRSQLAQAWDYIERYAAEIDHAIQQNVEA